MIDNIPNIKNTGSNNFFLIAGPCAIEGEEMALEIAERIFKITNRLEIPFIFKGSFKKANRSRIDSFTGIGDEKALKILRKVGETFTSIQPGFLHREIGKNDDGTWLIAVFWNTSEDARNSIANIDSIPDVVKSYMAMINRETLKRDIFEIV